MTTETLPTAVDDLAEALAVALHKHMHLQAEVGWPSDVERLTFENLDASIALFLAFLDQLDAGAAA